MTPSARRFVAGFAILALLVQMAVAAAHDPAAMQGTARIGASLCHAGGGADRSAPTDPANANSCPVCQLLAACGSFLPPPQPAAIVAMELPSPRYLQWLARAAAAPSPRVTAQPRAPPAFV